MSNHDQSCEYVDVQTIRAAAATMQVSASEMNEAVKTMHTADEATAAKGRASADDGPDHCKLTLDLKSEEKKGFFTKFTSGEFNILSTKTDPKSYELKDVIYIEETLTCEESEYANSEAILYQGKLCRTNDAITSSATHLTEIHTEPGRKQESTKPQTDNLYEQLHFDTDYVFAVHYDTMCLKRDVETLNEDNSIQGRNGDYEEFKQCDDTT